MESDPKATLPFLIFVAFSLLAVAAPAIDRALWRLNSTTLRVLRELPFNTGRAVRLLILNLEGPMARLKHVTHRTRKNAEISRPPGASLLALVDFLFSPKTVELTFKPLVADWRSEYCKALCQGRTLKARWISVRYRYSFLMAMSLSKLIALLRELRSVTR
jgi:hypothetical protein